MLSRKLTFWLLFVASGAIAYFLVFLESFWPMGRIIAGWYAIFAIVVLVGAAIVWLSLKLGILRYRPGFLDMFYF